MTLTTICTGRTYPVNPDVPAEGSDIHHAGMCPAHPDAVRPPAGTRVAVTFPENAASDAETVTGTVVSSDHDSIDIRRDDDGETFTLFDGELARGKASLEVIG